MESIEERLKSEAKIIEVHDIIHQVLNTDTKPEKKSINANWKFILLIVAIFFVGLTGWLFHNYNKKSSEIISPSKDTYESNQSKINPSQFIPTSSDPAEEDSNKVLPTESKKSEKASERIEKKIRKEKKQETTKPIAAKKSKPSRVKNKATSENTLLTSAFTPKVWESNNVRSSSEGASIELKLKAKEKYNGGLYKEAFALIETIAKEYQEDWEVQFYKASCLMKTPTPNYKEAILTFHKIIGNDDNIYIEDAEWFLIGTHLHMGNKSVAKSLLQEKVLIYPSHKYYKMGKELNERLRK